jgi:hypothetical protein
MIPFLIGYNTLRKESTVKNIMGNAVIGIAVIVIFVFIVFAFNANTIYDNNKWSARIKQYNEAADRGKENVNLASAKSVQSVSPVAGYEGNGADRTESNQQTKQQILDNNVAISFRVLSGCAIGLSDVTSQPRFEYMLDNLGDGKRTARQILDAALNAGDAELAARVQFDIAKLMIQKGDWIGQVQSGISQVSPVPAVSTSH